MDSDFAIKVCQYTAYSSPVLPRLMPVQLKEKAMIDVNVLAFHLLRR